MKKILLALLLVTSLFATENTRTNISFDVDKDGNLNPSLFVPIYYGSDSQFYSAVGYSSGNIKEITDKNAISGFSDSKNALISTSKTLSINYFTYKNKDVRFPFSFGLQSKIINIQNNEFGYLKDDSGKLGTAGDYYVFDNDVELDIYQHDIYADIELSFGTYFNSRISTTLSPFTSINVKQSTIFKPLVSTTGASDSSSTQDFSYAFKYDVLLKTGLFFDIGFLASYENLPLKYDVDVVNNAGNDFTKTQIDTTEISTKFIGKILLNKEMLGGLKPVIGYGIDNIKTKNNIDSSESSIDNKIIVLGFEKIF